MRVALIAGVFLVALLAAVSVASAQQFSTTVNYPDGSVSFNQNFGAGINARIFVDTPGDFDIFTHHTNSVGAFVNLSIQGFPAGVAYWLNFIGTSGNRLVFDVFATTGGPFFFVGQLIL